MGLFKDFYDGKVVGPREPLYSFTLNVKKNPTSVDCHVVKEPVLFHGKRRTRLAVYPASLPQSYQSEDTQLARVTGEWIHTDEGVVFRALRSDNVTAVNFGYSRRLKRVVEKSIKWAVWADESPIVEWQSSDNRSKGGKKLYWHLEDDQDLQVKKPFGFFKRYYIRRKPDRVKPQNP